MTALIADISKCKEAIFSSTDASIEFGVWTNCLNAAKSSRTDDLVTAFLYDAASLYVHLLLQLILEPIQPT
jgi:hypothetical protein